MEIGALLTLRQVSAVLDANSIQKKAKNYFDAVIVAQKS
jgi:hypothetical protein